MMEPMENMMSVNDKGCKWVRSCTPSGARDAGGCLVSGPSTPSYDRRPHPGPGCQIPGGDKMQCSGPCSQIPEGDTDPSSGSWPQIPGGDKMQCSGPCSQIPGGDTDPSSGSWPRVWTQINYIAPRSGARNTSKHLFPTIGNFLGRVSNHWKLFVSFFQPLETFVGGFPTIGNFSFHFSNHWKTIVLAVFVSAVAVHAAPLPGFRYCGQVVDEDGKPYNGDAAAVIVMTVDGQEVHRCDLLLEPVNGCNYELEAPQYTGRDAYRNFAVKRGAIPMFYLREANGTKILNAGGDIPPVGDPGDVVRVDFWTGTDADGDGLSDAFEQEMLDTCGGQFASIAEIDPNADADGDGFSNLQEFIAGTDATWSSDFFCADNAVIVSGKWMRLEFETTQGRRYRVSGSQALGQWSPAAASISPGGISTEKGFVGTGYAMTLYAPMTNGMCFFKLTVE